MNNKMLEEYVKLNEKGRGVLAEMYLEEMETRFLEGKPYFNTLDLASDIMRRGRCSPRDSIGITKIIASRYRDRLVEMGYEVSKKDMYLFSLERKIIKFPSPEIK